MEDQNTINQSVFAQMQKNESVHHTSKQTYDPQKTQMKTEDSPNNDETADTTHEAQKCKADNFAQSTTTGKETSWGSHQSPQAEQMADLIKTEKIEISPKEVDLTDAFDDSTKIYDSQGERLHLVSGSYVLYRGTKLEANRLQLENFTSIELTNKSRLNRYFSLAFNIKQARQMEKRITQAHYRLSDFKDALFMCYDQTRSQDSRQCSAESQKEFKDGLVSLLHLPQEITRTPKQFDRYLHGGFLDLSWCEAKLSNKRQFLGLIQSSDLTRTQGSTFLEHELLTSKTSSLIPGEEIKVNGEYESDKISLLVNTMFDTGLILEQRLENGEPMSVLTRPHIYKINTTQCIEQMLKVYLDTFPIGVATLEDLIRGVVACIATDLDRVFERTTGNWWEWGDSSLSTHKQTLLKLLSLVFGIIFKSATARQSWVLLWTSCLYTIRVNLAQTSDKTVRPKDVARDIFSERYIELKPGDVLISNVRQVREWLSGRCLGLNEGEEKRYFAGLTLLSATEDEAGLLNRLNDFENQTSDFIKTFFRPNISIDRQGKLVLMFGSVKHEVDQVSKDSALEYLIVNLHDTQLTRFTLNGPCSFNSKRIKTLADDLKTYCNKMCDFDDNLIALLDTYTDILIGRQKEKTSLEQLVELCTVAWVTQFNQHRMFLALRCDLVRELILQKQAFNSEVSEILKIQNLQSIVQLQESISTCPFYLDVTLRRFLLRCLASKALQQTAYLSAFQGISNYKRCNLILSDFSTSFASKKVSLSVQSLLESQTWNQNDIEVYETWDRYRVKLEKEIQESNAKPIPSITQDHEICLNLLHNCLNPRSGPKNRKEFLNWSETLQADWFGQQILFVPRLEWFVYEMQQHPSLQKQRAAFQDQCIEMYKRFSRISTADWKKLIKRNWPPKQQ